MSKKHDNTGNLSIKDSLSIALWSIKILLQIDKKGTILYVFLSIISKIQGILNIYLVSKAFNQLVSLVQTQNAQLTDMLPITGLLLGYNILAATINFFYNYVRSGLSLTTDAKIDKILYDKLQSLGIKTLEDPKVNNRITRAQREIMSIQNYFSQIISVVGTAVSLIINTIIILKFSPILILVIGLAGIPARIVDKRYRKLIWRFSWENTEKNRSANYTSNDLRSTTTLPELMINKATKYLDKKYMMFVTWYAKENIKLRKHWYLGTSGWGILQDLGLFVGYLVIFGRALKKLIGIGDVYFQTQVLQRLSGDMDTIIAMTNNIFEYSIRMNEAYLLFKIPAENTSGTVKLEKLNMGPEIEFKNLVFKYPNTNKKVIDKLNLKIKSGEKIAIVGANGAGKTTLMKILCNIYEPTSGEILINGHLLKDIQNSTWYENVGVLFQDYNTHSQLTVKENIIIGNPNIKFSSKKMVEAAQNADALEFIQEYPYKFDQVLSQKFEKGIRPSTGQWQKIAIARFFYRNAPLVIFDEPTASIDAVSEYNIFNKIYGFFKDKTVIIISHRFSTVRNADRILVLDKGAIVEDGTHEKLMKIEGKYATSFRLQAKGYK